MTNEQTQAEKLAETGQPQYTPDRVAELICRGHQNICGGPYNDKYAPVDEYDATFLIKAAITQATAELRAAHQAELRDAVKGAQVLVKAAQENERKAQAQVAALVEAITIAKDLPSEINTSNYSEDDVINLNDDCIKAYGVLEAALDDTQATADAYTAKVRQEAREAAVGECMEALRLAVTESSDLPFFIEVNSALQALLPAEKKGGV